jgi:adenosine deaminase
MDRRDLRRLPKAHLHLHFTGGMRRATLVEWAGAKGIGLPSALRDGVVLRGGPEGWGRFQRLYDIARSTIQSGDDVRRLVLEIAEDDAAAGSGWLELQVDPTTYAPRLGGLIGSLETVLEAAGAAAAATGVGIGVIVAANRARHPMAALTLARLAARYAGVGVVGFGLSNDERAGAAADFVQAFHIARNAGLLACPHGGELLGHESVRDCVELLGASRVGHAVNAATSAQTMALMAARGVAAEVCPASNVALGVAPHAAAVPLRALAAAGVPVALGADDPLLFGSGLVDQYEAARHVHGFTDTELAGLARASVSCSAAPTTKKAELLAGVDRWLEEPVVTARAAAARGAGRRARNKTGALAP